LPAGTLAWRIHRASYAATSFNPTAHPSELSGGRFDSLDGSFAYLYLGDSPEAAVAETLCRELPFDGRARLVPRNRLTGLVLSQIQVVDDLPVVLLHGAHLTQVGQDLWLTKSEARDYVLTRRWAVAIRAWAPSAVGFAYRCRHDEDRSAWVLFSDGAADPGASLRAQPSVDVALESSAGHWLVEAVLHAHNAALDLQ
jgi:hypothetical protein